MSLFETAVLNDNVIHLHSNIKQDDITKRISNAFDYEFDGSIKTDIYTKISSRLSDRIDCRFKWKW